MLARSENGPLAAASTGSPEATIDFNRRIRPILSENCFTCHGPDEKKRKAGLRLDIKSDAFKQLKSGSYALVPGDLEKSELIRRLVAADSDDLMPPPKSGKHLTADQIKLLRDWVAQGAPYRDHWAYMPPERPKAPPVRLQHWPRNPIDNFVLDRLEHEGLRPSPEASRETLIRRASLDLTGLPPTLAEVEDFQRDNRSDAYERLVDRLLDSPRYGERWARPWLDQARYADSNGYEADFRRTIWPYRDWVIRALNRDLPFDQFTIEQLAGDLLPNSTLDQRIATGFHRNTMVNTEGGTDEEEFRVAAILDRVNTTFGVWMGTTIGCAQCHSHKYDPFSQREYYQLFAFFNQTNDKGRSNDPELELPTPEQTAKREAVRAQIAPLEKTLNTPTSELDELQSAWESTLQNAPELIDGSWTVLSPGSAQASDGVQLACLPDGSVRAGGALPDNSSYEIATSAPTQAITALRLEALADPELPNGSCGRSEDGDFVLTELSLQALAAEQTTNQVAFETAYADFSMENYDIKAAIDGKPKTGWSVAAFEATNRVDHEAVFILKAPLAVPEGTRLLITLKQDSDRQRHLLGRFRLSISSASQEVLTNWAKLPTPIRRLLAIPAAERDFAQNDALATYYRSIDPGLDKVRDNIAQLKKQEPTDVAKTLIMATNATERVTQILIRGSHLNKGDTVSAAVPAVLHRWPEGQPTNRLGLARWLIDPANPLVGRVTMNRIWAQYFGRGIVETSEEFGAQGEAPTHPELLDWLATEFIRQGWSLKAMHRLIATSATYRQSSTVSADLAERDPFNRLLARGPRFRMEAEMLRDTALAIAGLLRERIGGPSVFPHQPDGVWNSPYNGDRWAISTQGDQFRRGIYTFARRTAPYASFAAFDAPSREVMCERRPRSNTPVQALVTLNDPAFVAAANGLARRILSDAPGADLQGRLVFAFETCLSRRPDAAELPALERLYQKSLERFRSEPTAAEKLVKVGLDKPEPGADLAELAAWTVISNVLLNLDESLTKG